MSRSKLDKPIRRMLVGLAVVCLQSMTLWAADAGTGKNIAGSNSDSVVAEALIAKAESPETRDREGKWTREWLEAHGILFEMDYRADLFTNLRGGLGGKHRAEYLGSFDSSVALDLKKLHVGRGSIVVSAQSLHGEGMNGVAVGTLQPPSNLDNAAFTKFVEVYYTDRYFEHRVMVKVGRLYGDGDFNVIENGAEFLNASYGLIPTVLMPTYPDPKPGAIVSAAVTPCVAVSVGIFQGMPLEGVDGSSGAPSTGVFTIAEARLDPFSNNAGFHGSYHVGVWQQSNGAWVLGKDVRPERNYGVFATGDQWFRKASSTGENSGPGVFFQMGWSPADRNQISSYWGAGVAYAGLLSQRPRDAVGIGVTQARLSAGGAETALELFYKIQATKRAFLQPDVQWIAHVAGAPRNALLGGLRFGVTF